MSMCIYYKDRADLDHNTREHVIPKGLGGKLRLPKGYVSKEFNTDISKLEKEFMRESPISIPRQFDGPGSEGKMGLAHAKKSKVLLFENKESGKFSLGYMQRGKSFEIPFLQLNTATGVKQFSIPAKDTDTAYAMMIEQYIERAKTSETLKIKRVNDDRLPPDIVLIGIQAGIEEHRDCFIFKNPVTETEVSATSLRDVTEQLDLEKESYVSMNYKPLIAQTVTLKPPYLRIFGKIAFNFLAASYGIEAARLDVFDGVRDWITGKSDIPQADFDFVGVNPFSHATPQVQKGCHTIVIYKTGNQLLARVAIYDLPVKILMANNFENQFTPIGFVCDWTNHKESGVSFVNPI